MNPLHRRTLLRALCASCVGTLACPTRVRAQPTSRKAVVAAVQYAPVLGDVDSNLSRAATFVDEAAKRGARWVILPEFFTSGLAMHPLMFDAVRPIDGAPMSFLTFAARKHGIYVGGSFLALSGRDVFNTFVLATPDGNTMMHDKDFPSTGYESSFYAPGEDKAYVEKLKSDGIETLAELVHPRAENRTDGVFPTNDNTVGVALCWELIRYRTTRRLSGKIDMLIGASGWWWATPEFDWPGLTSEATSISRKEQLRLIQEAPRRQARMLGVPVVHANFVGLNPGLFSDRFDQSVTGRYLGQSQIVDGRGNSIKILGEREEGIVIAEVEMGRKNSLEPIPADEFWMPEFDESIRADWSSSGAKGRNYYLTETRRRISDVTKR